MNYYISFFFFKQKTAYEMRISDWSSDVCSSDLIASTEVAPADVFVIAVPTPHDEEHRPDIGHVLSAARAIAPKLEVGNLVILESTSPVGTTEKVAALLAELRPDLKIPGACSGAPDIFVAYCPDRVLPGSSEERRVGKGGASTGRSR